MLRLKFKELYNVTVQTFNITHFEKQWLTVKRNDKNPNEKHCFYYYSIFFETGTRPHPSAAVFQPEDKPCVFILCELKWQRANGNSSAGESGSPLPVDAPLLPGCGTTRCVDFEAGARPLFRGSLCVGKGVGSSGSPSRQFPALSFLRLPCNLPSFKHTQRSQMLLRLIRGPTAGISTLLLSLMHDALALFVRAALS